MQIVEGAGLIATSARTASPGAVHRPRSGGDALALRRAANGPVTFVAGGTDLCAQLNEGLSPGTLIALDRAADLRVVERDGDVLRLGSGVTHAEGAAHPLVRALLPGFAAAWGRVANVRVRAWATLGGNLMALRPRYEMSLLLTALDARLHFATPDGGECVLSPAQLWDGLAPAGALLRHVAVPLRGEGRFHYDRGLRPIVTLAVCRDAAGCRAAIGTEMLPPVLLPVNAALPPEAAAAAALAALPESFADAATSHWYLRRAGTALLRRGLESIADA